MCVFLQRSEILHWENKSDMEFQEKTQTTKSKSLFGGVGQRKRYRNFAYNLCSLPVFPAKLLICFQTLISLKRIKLELFEFDVRF